MKKLLFILVVFCATAFAGNLSAEEMVLNGIYQGKDLYVKNPFSSDGVGFCVYEVSVNGILTRDEINSSAFAIDFNILGINVGTTIEVVLKHKTGCDPMVLNPESIKPHSSFEIKSIKVDGSRLVWIADSESGPLPYIIEQFRWNKWVKAGEVQGAGTPGLNQYSFELTPHSGENKVRVKQIDYTKRPRYSESVTFTGRISQIKFEPKKPDNTINFSAATRYEIFDKFGNLVKTGFSQSVDVASLQKGEEYYLNYDNSFGETFRKK